MSRHTLIIYAAVLSALSFAAAADTKSEAEQQVTLHAAMGAQARASKDFGVAAHCAKLVRDNTALVAKSPTNAVQPGDHESLAAAAEKRAQAHRAMLRTASFSRDPSMVSHCRSLVAQYTAESNAHRELAKASR